MGGWVLFIVDFLDEMKISRWVMNEGAGLVNIWVAEGSRINRKVNANVLGHDLPDKRLV